MNVLDHLGGLLLVNELISIGVLVESLIPIIEKMGHLLAHSQQNLLHEELRLVVLMDSVAVVIHELPQIIKLTGSQAALETIEVIEKIFESASALLLERLGLLGSSQGTLTSVDIASVT